MHRERRKEWGSCSPGSISKSPNYRNRLEGYRSGTVTHFDSMGRPLEMASQVQ
jgi:hypothetical protein